MLVSILVFLPKVCFFAFQIPREMNYNTGVHLGFICSNGDIASDILYTVFMSLKCLVACYVTSTNQTYNGKLISHSTKFFTKITMDHAANLHS